MAADKKLKALFEAMMEKRPVKMSGDDTKYYIESVNYNGNIQLMDTEAEFVDYPILYVYIHICTDEELAAEKAEEA